MSESSARVEIDVTTWCKADNLPQTALFWLVNFKVLNFAAQSSSFVAELKFRCSSSCLRNGFESMSPPEVMQYSPGRNKEKKLSAIMSAVANILIYQHLC